MFKSSSQIIANELKTTITLESIVDSIQNNNNIDWAKEETLGRRPVPAGGPSPFMIIDEAPSDFDIKMFFEEENSSKKIDVICQKLDLDRKEVYLTCALKYPRKKNLDVNNQVFNDGRAHINHFFLKELLIINPEIIFLVGNWVQKLFLRVFKIMLQPSLQKVCFNFTIDDKELEYEAYIYPIDSLENFPDIYNVKKIIKNIRMDWKFVHLHCHNSLSLKDGVGTPETRIKWHKEHKKPAIATTNHGNISDWIKIYEGSLNNNMIPILGIEAYFNRYAEELKKALLDDSVQNKETRKDLKKYNRHLTLLAKNEAGFYNLIKIHNDAWLNCFYRVPICSPETIQQFSNGIICLSGCSSGEQNKIIFDKIYLQSEERKKEVSFLIENKIKSITTLFNTKNEERAIEDEYLDENDMKYFYSHREDSHLDEEDYRKYVETIIFGLDEKIIQEADKQARDVIDWWHGIFKDDYYIEIMVIDYPPQKYINEELIKIAKEKNIPMVITNDCHYLIKADSKIQAIQMLSEQGKTFKDLEQDQKDGTNKIWTIKSEELYYKSVNELYEAWEKWHKSDIFTEETFWESINNTIRIVDKVELFNVDRSIKLPHLYENKGKSILIKKVLEGMKKYNLVGKKEYQERIKYELDVIIEKGFVDYFLVLEDLVSWIKNTYGDLAVGPGRGSAAGSLVNYCLGLTSVNPIKHNLLFERFMDPSREDLPDVDQDVQPRIRDAVIKYLTDKYGSDNVATIGTFSMLKLRTTILDVARVFGIPVQETLSMTTKLPLGLNESRPLKEIEEEFTVLKDYLNKNENPDQPLRYYIDNIRGTQRQCGTHAAGVLISSIKLKENIPLIRSKKAIVTGWIDGEDGRELSGLNYSKMDILGLKNLEVIEDTIKLIEQRHGEKIDINNIDIDDPFVFENVIKAGDSFGCFQFESSLAKQLFKKIQPDTFQELADISSLMRPGPLEMGTPDLYANRKHGILDDNNHIWTKEDIPNCIKDILGPTYGLLCYQEQIMQIAERIGGYSKKETNRLRKLLIKYGKFSKSDTTYVKNIKKYHDKFIENAAKPENLKNAFEAEKLWELMENFASYGFNLSHAISYTMVSFREYWLKAYYNAEFNVALLNNTDVIKAKKGESVLALYITEITRKGFDIISPSINQSNIGFTLNRKGEIVWGLGSIKNITNRVMDKIIEERNNGLFADIQDLFSRVSASLLNKRVIDALVWSGSFDEFIDKKNLKDRFDIYHYIYTVVRKDKKYKPIQSSKRWIFDMEEEYCKLSLSEAKLFIKIRKNWEKDSGQVNSLYEVEDIGNGYKGIGKIVKIENRITKTKSKKDYLRISMRDSNYILKNIYCWPWKLGQERIKELKTGILIYAEFSNESGFINMEKFISMGDRVI